VTTARNTYLGWDLLQHFDGCKRPEWTVDVRTDYDAFRSRGSGAQHACPAEDCGHDDRYERTAVRIVCFSCTRAHVISGEQGLRAGSAETVTDGYGEQPRRMAGLLMWPGEPFPSFGQTPEEPWDFVVTRTGVTRVTEDDVVGLVSQTRGQRGAVRWAAVAVRDENGEYGWRPLKFAACEDGLRTPAAAAKWVAARLAAAAAPATVGGEDR
jgi:hypothetical protein